LTTPGEPAATPGSMIVTFAGLHLREIGGWVAVADLIRLLGLAGQPPTAVRQALVRLKSRQFLASQTREGRAGYVLTETGLADLELGDARIFRFGEATESEGWVLALFSVPEQARAQRHRLRSNLSWLGFGTVSPGARIAPAALAQRATALIESEGLAEYVTWFTAQTVGQADVAAWWDLDGLRSLYQDFLQRWEPHASAPYTGDDVCFVEDVALVDDWRQFPLIDPGLPASLLPAGWQGRRAFELFSALRERWSEPGRHFVLDSLGRPSTHGAYAVGNI
jgi:phenylacetic acid degradation operon negative regulatory protein